MKFGEAVRYYRKKKVMTLRELSGKTGLSIAQLSKLENEKSKPSIDSLRKLAQAFEVPVSALTLTEEVPILIPVRNGDGFNVRWLGKEEGQVEVRYLTLNRYAKMQPIVVTIQPGVDSGISKSHPSDEFFYVLAGKVRFFYGEDYVFDMDPGDFLYYDGNVPHHWENICNKVVQLLTCNDPPVM